jgi:hypothetical protein
MVATDFCLRLHYSLDLSLNLPDNKGKYSTKASHGLNKYKK